MKSPDGKRTASRYASVGQIGVLLCGNYYEARMEANQQNSEGVNMQFCQEVSQVASMYCILGWRTERRLGIYVSQQTELRSVWRPS